MCYCFYDEVRSSKVYSIIFHLSRLRHHHPSNSFFFFSLSLSLVSACFILLLIGSNFQTGYAHMALVSKCPLLTTSALRNNMRLEGNVAPIGIITLEDIFEVRTPPCFLLPLLPPLQQQEYIVAVVMFTIHT